MKPYRRGFKAFKEGELDNPFNVGTQRWKDWELGFNKAYFLNLEQVRRKEKGQRVGGKKKYNKPRTGSSEVYS